MIVRIIIKRANTSEKRNDENPTKLAIDNGIPEYATIPSIEYLNNCQKDQDI